MKTFKIFSLLLLIAGVTIFTGCEKEGPEGPSGKDGIDGVDGVDGEDGNANVVSGTITSSSWIYVEPSWVILFNYAAITQDIIDNGAVLVYMKFDDTYFQLPFTAYQSSNYSTSVEVASYTGGLSIIWTDSDLTQPDKPGEFTFKIVVITASALAQFPDIDFSDYNAVQGLLN